jgi:hypothetical protein
LQRTTGLFGSVLKVLDRLPASQPIKRSVKRLYRRRPSAWANDVAWLISARENGLAKRARAKAITYMIPARRAIDAGKFADMIRLEGISNASVRF